MPRVVAIAAAICRRSAMEMIVAAIASPAIPDGCDSTWSEYDPSIGESLVLSRCRPADGQWFLRTRLEIAGNVGY